MKWKQFLIALLDTFHLSNVYETSSDSIVVMFSMQTVMFVIMTMI